MYALIFLALFVGLFFTSRLLTQTISYSLFVLTRKQGLSIQLMAVLFLPGVILHELAHWLIASIFLVPTGEIEFFPQIQGSSVKLGSVQVAKTDPFRMFFIAIAPVLFGGAVLLALFWFLSPSFFPITWRTVVFLYVVFEIGNTMFSSRKDLEGVIGFVIFFILISLFLLFLKVPIISVTTSLIQLPTLQTLFLQLSQFFLLAIGIDMLSILILRFLLSLKR